MSQEQPTTVTKTNTFLSRLGSFMETAVEKTGWLYKVAHRRNVVVSNPEGKRLFALSLAWTGIFVILSTFFPFLWRVVLIVGLVAAVFFGVRFHIEPRGGAK